MMSHYNTLLSSLSYSLFCSLATASNQRYQIFATFINEKLWFSPVLENFKVSGILKKASPWIEPPWLLTKKKDLETFCFDASLQHSNYQLTPMESLQFYLWLCVQPHPTKNISLRFMSDSSENCPVIPYEIFFRNDNNIQSEWSYE